MRLSNLPPPPMAGKGDEMTKIMECTCTHEYQDSKYGTRKRVHNAKRDGKRFVCTVCLSTKEV